MKQYIHAGLLATLVMFTGVFASCGDFLNQRVEDRLSDSPDFYNSEQNIRYSLNSLLPRHFPGYASGWVRSSFGNQTTDAAWSDDLAQNEPSLFMKNAPTTASNTGWGFDYVKKINLLLQGLSSSSMADEALKHWTGVCRFYRGLEYAALVSRFGDVPYYDTPTQATDEAGLYAPRQDRGLVMEKVLEDLQYASKNVRVEDGVKGLAITKDVVDAYAARVMLFEASWQKYHKGDKERAAKFFQAVKDFSSQVITSGRYRISDDYHALTTSVSLAGNPEIIMYREYVAGVLTHSVMSFDIEQPQKNAPSKSLIESYCTKNGLPIHQSGNAQYKGDKLFLDEVANRDPRLGLLIRTDNLHLEGIDSQFSATGYFFRKFTNDELIGTAAGQSATNVMDAPVLRYAEVLLSYAEAAAELQTLGKYTLTQADIDSSLNAIRARKGVGMPALTLAGGNFQANGVVLNDPRRDADVPSLLWEVRRERRVELSLEGFRFNDLRRWKKLEKADMFANPDLNKGSYLDKQAFVDQLNKKLAPGAKPYTLESLKALVLFGGPSATIGYIRPATKEIAFRKVSDRDYLYPIPLDQITLYSDKAKSLGKPEIKLEQNPGW